MVHDTVTATVEAVGVPVLTGRVDIANARLRFANGCIANLTASRISRDRVRRIRFFQPASYVSIDYAAQKVEKWTLDRMLGIPSIQGGDVPVVLYDVKRGKPAPDLFLDAARRMHAEPNNCIVVEDSAAGVSAATAA